MSTTSLPQVILSETRSNTPFLIWLSLVMGCLMIAFYSTESGYPLVMGVSWLALGGALACFVVWAVHSFKANGALLDSLTQSELVSMLEREADTWRSSDSVIRVLDRRFPAWRETQSGM